MTFDNRTYCSDPIGVPEVPWVHVGISPINFGPTTNAIFLGYVFSITPWSYGFSLVLNTTIVEPNGTIFHGGPYWTGEARYYSNSWFAPGNASGVYAVPYDGGRGPAFPVATVVLLAEVGA
ncbi:MAG TPA: hypothetical protein VEH57_02145 [Thermoplasmata archaeon]|nr:hypothetical protein [Thermoplasmata archaeon]